MPEPNWSEEQIETLRRLWAEGLSAAQISKQLEGKSRSAVIGKVHRLKLTKRGRVVSTKTSPAKPPRTIMASTDVAKRPRGRSPKSAYFDFASKAATSVGKAAEMVRVVDPEPMVPTSRRLALIQLTETTCRWPNGNPLAEDFGFCGQDADGRYCTYHSRIAFQPVSERRRVR
jgi:GcrA cell cycle regulator